MGSQTNPVRFRETTALLDADQSRSRHLASNWFHQTWKLHCYLILAAGVAFQQQLTC